MNVVAPNPKPAVNPQKVQGESEYANATEAGAETNKKIKLSLNDDFSSICITPLILFENVE
jgi:hypothetical protein